MAEKLCPVCETPNEPGAKHCEVCGERLTVQQVTLADQVGIPHKDPDKKPEESLDAMAEAVPSSFQDQSYEPEDTQMQALLDFDEKMKQLENEVAAEAAAAPTPKPVPAPVPTPAPAPTPLVSSQPAKILVYFKKEPVHAHPINHDETLVGRYDPASDAYPQLDLTQWDESKAISRKHCYIYREAGQYYIYPITNAGTQLNDKLLSIGDKALLSSGDVIILAGVLAMKFQN